MKNDLIYCDTPFLIDYWETYELYNELTLLEANEFGTDDEKQLEIYFRDLLRYNKRSDGLLEIRKIIENLENKRYLISSGLALLEIKEKYAEVSIQNILSHILGSNAIKRLGKKQLSEIIYSIMDKKNPDYENLSRKIFTSLIRNQSNFKDEMFGIKFLDIKNFELKIEEINAKFSLFSILQIGTTDILHLLAAINLGSSFFFTFDKDFLKMKDFIEVDSDYEIEIVVNDIEYMKRILSGEE